MRANCLVIANTTIIHLQLLHWSGFDSLKYIWTCYQLKYDICWYLLIYGFITVESCLNLITLLLPVLMQWTELFIFYMIKILHNYKYKYEYKKKPILPKFFYRFDRNDKQYQHQQVSKSLRFSTSGIRVFDCTIHYFIRCYNTRGGPPNLVHSMHKLLSKCGSFGFLWKRSFNRFWRWWNCLQWKIE